MVLRYISRSLTLLMQLLGGVTGYNTTTTPNPAVITNGNISNQTLTVKNTSVSNNGLMVWIYFQTNIMCQVTVCNNQSSCTKLEYNVQVTFATQCRRSYTVNW